MRTVESFNGSERFEVLRLLGMGGMGKVYEVFDRVRRRKVALKLLSYFTPTQLYLFKQEFRSLAEMVHPHLVGLYDLLCEGEQWFFTMELVDGADFLTYVRGPRRAEAAVDQVSDTLLASPSDPSDSVLLTAPSDGASQAASRPGGTGRPASDRTSSPVAVVTGPPLWELDPAAEGRLRQALKGLATGVAALHESGRIHRDLKPTNVKVTPDGRTVILDFGLVVSSTEEPDRLRRNLVSGTVPYMSPEQAVGERVSPASDWYSFGVMLFEALTGRIPFSGSVSEVIAAKRKLPRIRPGDWGGRLPADLDDLCSSLLVPDPRPRPGASQVLARLGVLAGSGEHATQDAEWEVGSAERARAAGAASIEPSTALGGGQGSSSVAHDSQLGRSGLDDAEGGGGRAERRVRPSSYGQGMRAGPLVGREQELGALRELLARVRGGRGGTAWLAGQSGMGKSALLEAFRREAAQGGALLLAGRCFERESVPYKAVDAVVDDLARYLAALPAHEIERVLPRHMHALQQVFPVLADLPLSAQPMGRQMEWARDPRELQRRAFGALRELLGRLGDRVTLVVLIDDLQWGDLDSTHLLAELVRPPDAPVMMLVLAHRSEAAQTSQSLRMLRDSVAQSLPADGLADLELGPLAPPEAERLALRHCEAGWDSDVLAGTGEHAGQNMVAGTGEQECKKQSAMMSLAAHIALESQGVPFFIEELARAAAVYGDSQGASLPSLEECTRRRVTALPASARGFLELLAVAGRPLRQGLAWKAAGLPSLDLEELKRLQAGHLVRSEGATEGDVVETYHDRIRESVVGMLSGEMRRALHLSLAKCWEQEPAPDPEALALHFREAGESLKAALYARTAALAAAATLAFDRAAGLFASALEMGRWDEEELRGLYEGLATVLAAAGRGKEAAKAYQETAGRSEGEAAWRLQVLAAEQLLSAGYTEEGREVLGRALARFGIRIPRTPAGAIVGLLARTAWTRLRGLGFKPRREEEIPRGVLDRIDVCRAAALTMGLADPVRSSMFQARTLHLALAAGEPSRIARQLAAEGGYAAAFGGSGYARSARLLARSRELAEQTRDPQALATFHTCAAIAMFQQGRWEECGRHAEEAERCCLEGRLHAQWELHTSRLFHVGVVGWLGRFKEYRTRIGEMLAEADRRQDLQTANHIRAGAVLPIPLLWDDPAAALRELETCNRRLPQGELTLMHSYAMWARVCVALYAGDVSGALALARGFNARFRRSMLWKIGLVRIYAAESLGNSLLAAAGHVLPVREAAEGLAACIDRMRRIGLEWTATQAQLFEAGRQRLLEKAEAVQAYGAAAEGFERLSMAHYAAAARFRQGCLSESSAAGQELKQQAREAMSSEGVAAPERLFLALAPLPEAFRKQVG